MTPIEGEAVDRYHVVLSTEAGHVHETELDAVDAPMAAFITASRYVDRDDTTTHAHARRIERRGDDQ